MESDYCRIFTPKTLVGLLLAVGINLFIATHDLAFGGVAGMTIVIQSLTGIPLPLSNIVLSILVMLIRRRFLGRGFLVKTIMPTLATSLWLWLTTGLTTIAPNIIMSVIWEPLLMGVGLVIVVGGSTVDPDTIAVALKKCFKISILIVMWTINSLVILCGLPIYGLQTSIYAEAVKLFMTGTVKLIEILAEKLHK